MVSISAGNQKSECPGDHASNELRWRSRKGKGIRGNYEDHAHFTRFGHNGMFFGARYFNRCAGYS